MMDTFKVGEVAIYVRPDSPHYGKEVEILGGLYRPNSVRDHVTGKSHAPTTDRYKITNLVAHMHPHPYLTVKPCFLRKKRPPSTDITETREKGYDPELTPWSPPKRERETA